MNWADFLHAGGDADNDMRVEHSDVTVSTRKWP